MSQTIAPFQDEFAGAAESAAVAAHAERMVEAYRAYLRLQQGDETDQAARQSAHRELGASVQKMLEVHEFLEHELDGMTQSELVRLAAAIAPQEAAAERDADREPHWPALGAVWEGFLLLEELGRGQFARVYLARELALGERLVALKCTVSGPGEAALLGRLEHPHVVPIHSIRKVPADNLTCVCMPYLGRATLETVCKNQPQGASRTSIGLLLDRCRDPRLPEARPPAAWRRRPYMEGVRAIALQIASALEYLHGRGVTHRDLKPSNILLEPNGTARLLDFNLSSDPLSGQRLVGGTLRYMAPEQVIAFLSRNITLLSPQMDVFALGVILYEWLSGKHPFGPIPANGSLEILGRALFERQGAGPAPLPAVAGVDRPFAKLIERCLAFDPEARPRAGEVVRALRRQMRPHRRLARWLGRHPVGTAAAALLLSAAAAWGAHTIAAQPSAAERAYARGVEAYQNGDYRQAWEEFSQALAAGASPEGCLPARARAAHRLGDLDKQWFSMAVVDYAGARRLRSDPGELPNLAYCVHRTGEMAAADSLYKEALRQGISTPILHYDYGCLCYNRGRHEESRQQFELAIALDDDFAEAHFELASVLIALVGQEAVMLPQEEAMPDLVRQALQHLERGLPNRASTPGYQALRIGEMYGLASRFEEVWRERAVSWLERALDDGVAPERLNSDPLLQSLKTSPSFAALTRRPAVARAPSSWKRLLDPLVP